MLSSRSHSQWEFYSSVGYVVCVLEIEKICLWKLWILNWLKRSKNLIYSLLKYFESLKNENGMLENFCMGGVEFIEWSRQMIGSGKRSQFS